MKHLYEKRIEYQVHTGLSWEEDDVNCVSWREAKRLIANPPTDLLFIERVTRYGCDGQEYGEPDVEQLFERQI